MKIENNAVAAISYTLHVSAANMPKQMVETVPDTDPMYFLVGQSGLPDAFEDQLIGLSAGDKFKFELQPEEAFGLHHAEDVLNLPIEDFYDETGKLDTQMIAVGNMVPLHDQEGNHLQARVLEINADKGYIKMDFNHPLAGKDLYFEGRVVMVREATPEELDHGHVHGEGGHHH